MDDNWGGLENGCADSKRVSRLPVVLGFLGFLALIVVTVVTFVTFIEKRPEVELLSQTEEVTSYTENMDWANVTFYSGDNGYLEGEELESELVRAREERVKDFPELADYDGGYVESVTFNKESGFYITGGYDSSLFIDGALVLFFNTSEERESSSGISSTAKIVYITSEGEIVEVANATPEGMKAVMEND